MPADLLPESPAGVLSRRSYSPKSKVFAWGVNEDGQFGDGTDESAKTPVPITSVEHLSVRRIISGSRSSLAITKKGELFAWGWNQRGTLGLGHKTNEWRPAKVAALGDVRVVSAAIGGWHCIALDDQGQCYTWGGNEYGQCGIYDSRPRRDVLNPISCVPQLTVVQVQAGGQHSLVLTARGEVWSWGQQLCCHRDPSLRKPHKEPRLRDVVQIAAGAFHNLALCANGDVYAWGLAEYGQLGIGDVLNVAEPQIIQELCGKGVVQVAAGGWHSAALTATGQVYIWGRGEHGRLGLGDDVSRVHPVLLESLANERVVQISLGGSHSAALTEDGVVYIWGRGDFGRLGHGDTITLRVPRVTHIPVPVESPVRMKNSRRFWQIVQISAGGRHTLVLARKASRRLLRRTAAGPQTVDEDDDCSLISESSGDFGHQVMGRVPGVPGASDEVRARSKPVPCVPGGYGEVSPAAGESSYMNASMSSASSMSPSRFLPASIDASAAPASAPGNIGGGGDGDGLASSLDSDGPIVRVPVDGGSSSSSRSDDGVDDRAIGVRLPNAVFTFNGNEEREGRVEYIERLDSEMSVELVDRGDGSGGGGGVGGGGSNGAFAVTNAFSGSVSSPPTPSALPLGMMSLDCQDSAAGMPAMDLNSPASRNAMVGSGSYDCLPRAGEEESQTAADRGKQDNTEGVSATAAVPEDARCDGLKENQTPDMTCIGGAPEQCSGPPLQTADISVLPVLREETLL